MWARRWASPPPHRRSHSQWHVPIEGLGPDRSAIPTWVDRTYAEPGCEEHEGTGFFAKFKFDGQGVLTYDKAEQTVCAPELFTASFPNHIELSGQRLCRSRDCAGISLGRMSDPRQ